MLIDNLIASTAVKFHAVLITPFFVDFAYCVLLEGFDLEPSMRYILMATAQSPAARHTNIVLMRRNAGPPSITSMLYVFTHPKWRPWGQCLPLACPKCSSPHSWSDEVKSGSTYTFTCRYKDCIGLYSVEKPVGFELYKPDGNGGRWMKRDYSF